MARSSKFNEEWEEIGDDTPVELPLGFKRPPTLQEQIKAFVRTALSDQARAAGAETFEEANDFDLGDEEDILPTSPHEFTEMQEEYLKTSLAEVDNAERAAREAAKDAEKQAPVGGAGGNGEKGNAAKITGSEIAADDSRRS